MRPILQTALGTLCAVLFAAAAPAHAADPASDAPDDLDALSLADKAPAVAQAPTNWRAYVEGAVGRDGWQGAPGTNSSRAAFDLRYDGTLAPGLRAVLSDRFDHARRGSPRHERNVNSLREAYLSWQRSPDLIVDAGRVNLRHGAAWGFNPTDYFKAGALRAIVSPDPASLRENRLGTVVLQGQKLWSDSSFSAALSPRLDNRPSDATFSLDLGATNAHDRWLLAGSHKFGDRFNPQLLLYGGGGTSTQLGLNLSTLLNDATVAFAEFSTGQDRTLIARALDRAAPEHTQRRAAVGLTYTTSFNLSFTAEADYNSAAPDRAQWDALSAADRLRVLDASQTLQDLPVRRAAFFYATWKDLLVKRLDLSAFVRHDAVTHSRAQWIETRYHWDRADLALQWQLNSGRSGSVFGSVPQERAVEVSLRWFL
jgi:hypothetical protein